MRTIPARRTGAALVWCVVAGATLTACFTSTGDFKTTAEDYIGSTVAESLGTVFDSVNCDAPDDQNVGTEFACSAIEDTGGVWKFDARIDGESSIQIVEVRRP